MKQLLVDFMLCFSFDRPVTDNCPILVLKKMYKIEKILPAASSCSILIFNEYHKKTQSVSLNAHHVQSNCLLPESTNQGFLKHSRYR